MEAGGRKRKEKRGERKKEKKTNKKKEKKVSLVMPLTTSSADDIARSIIACQGSGTGRPRRTQSSGLESLLGNNCFPISVLRLKTPDKGQTTCTGSDPVGDNWMRDLLAMS